MDLIRESEISSLVLICVFACVIQRSTLAFLSRCSFDTYGHLYFAKLVRKQKSGPFGSIKTNVLGSTSFHHPFLWHWVITIFGTKNLNYLKKLFNPILDSLFCGFIVYGAWISGFNGPESFICGLLYIFTPMWFTVLSLGPRVSVLTPRLTSEIFFCVSIMLVYCPFSISSPFKIILSSMCMTIVILSSKFGKQVIIFVVPFLIITTLSEELLYSLILCFFFSVVFSSGSIYDEIKSQFNHLIWYYRNNKSNNTSISNRNSISNLIKITKGLLLKEKLKLIFFSILRENSYSSTLIKIPFLVFFIYALISDYGFVNENHAQIIFPVVIIFIIINTKNFLFLGEAERYLNHISFFLIFGFIEIYKRIEFMYIIYFVFFGISYFAFEIIYLSLLRKRSHKREMVDRDIIKYILNRGVHCNIICYPFHSVGVYRILYETSASVIYPLNNHRFYDKVVGGKYPYVDLRKMLATDVGKEVNLAIVSCKNSREDIGESNIVFTNWIKSEIGLPFYNIYLRD